MRPSSYMRIVELRFAAHTCIHAAICVCVCVCVCVQRTVLEVRTPVLWNLTGRTLYSIIAYFYVFVSLRK
jgi:hypothetical protein